MRALRILQLEHRLFQQAEQTHYYYRRHQAMEEPHKYCSIAIDGADQRVCSIPSKCHYEYGNIKLKQKLVGALVHGLHK